MTIIQQRLSDWSKALRSGDYTQGHGLLKYYSSYVTDDELSHCPWGVACEVYEQHNPGSITWHKKIALDGSTRFSLRINEVISGFSFPISQIYKYFGFTYEEMRMLVNRNDSLFATFDDIATYLEDKGAIE